MSSLHLLDPMDLIVTKILLQESLTFIGSHTFLVDPKKGESTEYRIYFSSKPVDPCGYALDYYILILNCSSETWDGYELFYREFYSDLKGSNWLPRVRALHVNPIEVPSGLATAHSLESYAWRNKGNATLGEHIFNEPEWYRKCGCFNPAARLVTGSVDALQNVKKIIRDACLDPKKLCDRFCTIGRRGFRGCRENMCPECRAVGSWTNLNIPSDKWTTSNGKRIKMRYGPYTALDRNLQRAIVRMPGVKEYAPRYHIFPVFYSPAGPPTPYFFKAVPVDNHINIFMGTTKVTSVYQNTTDLPNAQNWLCRLIIRSKSFSVLFYQVLGLNMSLTLPFHSIHRLLSDPSPAHEALDKSRKLSSHIRGSEYPVFSYRSEVYSVSSLSDRSAHSSSVSDENRATRSDNLTKTRASTASPSTSHLQASHAPSTVDAAANPDSVPANSEQVKVQVDHDRFVRGHKHVIFTFLAHCMQLDPNVAREIGELNSEKFTTAIPKVCSMLQKLQLAARSR